MAKNLNNFFIHNCMDSKSSVWFAVVYIRKKGVTLINVTPFS